MKVSPRKQLPAPAAHRTNAGRCIVSLHSEQIRVVAWSSLFLCFLCAGWIALDENRQPQKMWVMNLVWPITALYLGPFAIWLYRRTLPEMSKRERRGAAKSANPSSEGSFSEGASPDRTQVLVAASHCGAGCTLGDIAGEIAVPALGLTFAGEFGSKLVADFVVAYVLGIAFQYFSIVPMRGLPFAEGLKTALRADTISILLFEIGMFGWMALSYFVLAPAPHLRPSEAAFWFMMQIAMICGYLTAPPANRWLIHKGWKEKMPQHAHADESQNLQAA